MKDTPPSRKGHNPDGHNQFSNADVYNPLTLRKAKALVMLERGATTRRVQAATGLARQTITHLRRGKYQVPASMIDALRAEEEAKFTVAAHRILDTLVDPDASDDTITKATLVQRATAVGILFDKARLVRGEPTAINQELRHMSDEELLGRINALRRKLFGEAAPQMHLRGEIPYYAPKVLLAPPTRQSDDRT